MPNAKTIDDLGTGPSENLITWLEEGKKGLEFLESAKARNIPIRTAIETVTPTTPQLEVLIRVIQKKPFADFLPPTELVSTAFRNLLLSSIGDEQKLKELEKKIEAFLKKFPDLKKIHDLLEKEIIPKTKDFLFIKKKRDEYQKG